MASILIGSVILLLALCAFAANSKTIKYFGIVSLALIGLVAFVTNILVKILRKGAL